GASIGWSEQRFAFARTEGEEGVMKRGGVASAIPPIRRPSRVVRDGNDFDLLFANAIDDRERILEQYESSAAKSRPRVSLRPFCNSRDCVFDFTNKRGGGRRIPVDIPR